jgi:hypothetical protein
VLTEEALLGAIFDVKNPMKVGDAPHEKVVFSVASRVVTSASDRLWRPSGRW